jgi:hypothetical protein
MDQNVVFVYPLNSVLSQLKAELEKDTTLTIFEVDLVEEYQQLVSNLSNSFTFSSDLKKTIRLLDMNKTIVTKKNHFNLFVSKDLPSSLVLSKMEKAGLNEALPDYTKIKVLQKKVDSFFRLAENFESEDPYLFLEKGKNEKKGDSKVERLTQDIKLQGDRPKIEKKDQLLKDLPERDSSFKEKAIRPEDEVGLEATDEKKKSSQEDESSEKNKLHTAYESSLETEKKKYHSELDYSEEGKDQKGADSESQEQRKQSSFDYEIGVKKKHTAFESTLDQRPQSAYEDDLSKSGTKETSYEDLLKTNKKNSLNDENNPSGTKQSSYEALLDKKKSPPTDLDYSKGKNDQSGFEHEATHDKKSSGLSDEKDNKAPKVSGEEKRDVLRVKSIAGQQESSEKNKLVVKKLDQSEEKLPSKIIDFTKYPEALLPEQVFYAPDKVIDPVAFFVEILLGDWDPEYKKKYLKMSLLKVYKTHIFTTSLDGEWEEGAPEALLNIDLKGFDKPHWLNEGKNQDENYFILPVAFDDKIVGAVGLATPGRIDHHKMGELEFWCYLGRCLWS